MTGYFPTQFGGGNSQIPKWAIIAQKLAMLLTGMI
jgi:hypothetical protein